jgi:ribosomal protein L40E
LLDQVGNSHRHGMPDDPREWSLTGSGRGKGKKDEDNIACRQCGECYAISPAAASKCRECGVEFPKRVREIDEVDGKLSEVEIARARREAAMAQAAAQTLEDLIRLGQMRGFKNPAGWARHVFQSRQARAR